jgi:hypothetical protein
MSLICRPVWCKTHAVLHLTPQGGMLGSGLCSQAGKWSKKLRSVTLLGSGCFGDGRCAKRSYRACPCHTTQMPMPETRADAALQ